MQSEIKLGGGSPLSLDAMKEAIEGLTIGSDSDLFSGVFVPDEIPDLRTTPMNTLLKMTVTFDKPIDFDYIKSCPTVYMATAVPSIGANAAQHTSAYTFDPTGSYISTEPEHVYKSMSGISTIVAKSTGNTADVTLKRNWTINIYKTYLEITSQYNSTNGYGTYARGLENMIVPIKIVLPQKPPEHYSQEYLEAHPEISA